MAKKKKVGRRRGRGSRSQKKGRTFTPEQLLELGVTRQQLAEAGALLPSQLPAAKAAKESLRTHPPMNKTEQRYRDHLQMMVAVGKVAGFMFEPMKLRLGPDWLSTYTPDFLVVYPDGLQEMVDVKGASKSAGATGGAWWEEDARLKIKVAAGLYPYRFVGVHEDASEPSGWAREVFPPG